MYDCTGCCNSSSFPASPPQKVYFSVTHWAGFCTEARLFKNNKEEISMNLLKNRTVIGVICIVLSLIICFAVTPLFNQSISEKTEIVRVVKPVKNGEEIQSDMVKQVEVGGYNLPEDVVKNSDTAIGKFATADLAPGDYILSSKLAEEPAAENAYLYHLTGEKQAISYL